MTAACSKLNRIASIYDNNGVCGEVKYLSLIFLEFCERNLTRWSDRDERII